MAKLHFKYGEMNSGKTLEILKTIYNCRSKDKPIILIKPLIDTKGGNCIISRNNEKIPVDYLIARDDNIYEIISKHQKDNLYSVLVDEAELLEPHHIDELSDVADFLDISVICFGLRTNFQDELFPASKRLFELADKLEEIKTICLCGHKANATIRYKYGIPQFDGPLVAIDGVDGNSYETTCRRCKKLIRQKYQS